MGVDAGCQAVPDDSSDIDDQISPGMPCIACMEWGMDCGPDCG